MKVRNKPMQVRLSSGAASLVKDWAVLMGWSDSYTASFFVLSLCECLTTPTHAATVLQVLQRQADLTTVLRMNKTRERDARAKLRQARKAGKP